jgi:pyruvate/2-oxoglutarate dehydrogenase complex dihydrolipoamide acyltransferase (E2) component
MFLLQRLNHGYVVNPGTIVGHINVGDWASKEVSAVFPGTLQRWMVPDGASVTQGQPILTLAPSESMVWEALRALYLVGRAEDLPDVDRFVRGTEGFSPQVAQQAQATSRAIRSRSSS